MRNVIPVTERELNGYFYSPIAYGVLTIFLLVCGIFFLATSFTPGGEASIRELQRLMPIILVVFLPIVTMRLLSEEYRSGTIETLMTAPISEGEIILGKYVGAFVFYLAMLGGTLLYVALMAIFGNVDVGLLVAQYLGLVLLGGLYLAVGLFFSVCTKNQILAAVAAVAVLVIFTFLADWLATRCEGVLKLLLHHLSISEHFSVFSRGLIDIDPLIFFITTSGLFLFFAAKVLESRRWR